MKKNTSYVPVVIFAAFIAFTILTTFLTIFAEKVFEFFYSVLLSVVTRDIGVVFDPSLIGPNINYIIVWVLAFIITLSLLYCVLNWISRNAVRSIGAKATSNEVGEESPKAVNMVIGYSPLKEGILKRIKADLKDLGGKVVALSTSEYKDYIKEKHKGREFESNFWQQNVRALAIHGDTLERVLVLENESGKFKELSIYLRDALSSICPNMKIERITDKDNNQRFFEDWKLKSKGPGVYSDFNYVNGGIRRGLHMILDGDTREGLTMIDVTPGPKTFSIAAAAITFNADRTFSYVDNEGKVHVHNVDLKISTPSLIGG